MAMNSTPLSRFADVTGDGTGNSNANGNYSAASVTDFQVIAGASEFIRIDRMIIQIEDGSGMRAERYGGLAAALTVGVEVMVNDSAGNTYFPLTDANMLPKSNAGWGAACYDVDVHSWGAGNDFLAVRWSFDKFRAIELDPGDRFVVRLNDDFTGIITHCFMMQGEIFAGRNARRSAIIAS